MEAKVKQLLKTIKLNESMLSVIFGMITVVLIGILVFRMYQGNKPEITSDADTTSVPQATETVGEVAVEVKETGEKFVVDQPETYTVQTGDHLWMIAEQVYGSGYNWVDIHQANKTQISNPNIIRVGQKLILPKTETKYPGGVLTGSMYKVVRGDSLWTIASRYCGTGLAWNRLAEVNSLANPRLIEPGQTLRVECK